MLISIVTTVRNRVGSVEAALQSLAAQTHRPIEHVIQDGLSTDGTLELLQERAVPGCKLVSEVDAGVYDALNKAMARTTGDVVGLLHSDDVFADPDVLTWVAAAFETPEVDAVYGDLDYVARDDPGRRVRAWRSQPFSPDLLARGWMPAHPTLFLRRRVVDDVGPYDTSFQISADYDYVLRCFRRPGFQAVHVPKVFVRMRMGGQSNGSLSHIVRKSTEDLRALRNNNVGGVTALLQKNIRKLSQFSSRVR